ncbi:MAG: phosphatase domain-containing protein, partial [Spirochaetota bacterium]
MYQQNDDASHEKAKARVRSFLGFPDEDREDLLSRQRVRRIFAEGESGKSVSVGICGTQITMISAAGGYFKGSFPENIFSDNQCFSGKNVIHYYAVLSASDPRIFKGIVIPALPQGVSVISDIDDTVKISNVADKRELLKNTFYRPYRSVPGMSDLYSSWADKGAVFHYLSGSPRQMYSLLAEFLASEGFPPGEFRLKRADLSDGSIISFLKA